MIGPFSSVIAKFCLANHIRDSPHHSILQLFKLYNFLNMKPDNTSLSQNTASHVTVSQHPDGPCSVRRYHITVIISKEKEARIWSPAPKFSEHSPNSPRMWGCVLCSMPSQCKGHYTARWHCSIMGLPLPNQSPKCWALTGFEHGWFGQTWSYTWAVCSALTTRKWLKTPGTRTSNTSCLTFYHSQVDEVNIM